MERPPPEAAMLSPCSGVRLAWKRYAILINNVSCHQHNKAASLAPTDGLQTPPISQALQSLLIFSNPIIYEESAAFGTRFKASERRLKSFRPGYPNLFGVRFVLDKSSLNFKYSMRSSRPFKLLSIDFAFSLIYFLH